MTIADNIMRQNFGLIIDGLNFPEITGRTISNATKKNSDAYYRETVLLHHCATRETGLEVTSIFRHKKTQEQRRNKARCPEESKEYGVTDSWENLVP